MGQAKFDHDELNTTIVEIKNSQCLSYVSTDEPLTPSHLLVGRRLLSLPNITHNKNDEEYSPQISRNHMSRRVKYLNTALDRFWQRW